MGEGNMGEGEKEQKAGGGSHEKVRPQHDDKPRISPALPDSSTSSTNSSSPRPFLNAGGTQSALRYDQPNLSLALGNIFGVTRSAFLSAAIATRVSDWFGAPNTVILSNHNHPAQSGLRQACVCHPRRPRAYPHS